eukprot:m.101784 g.101784  ORF g.101784 m.101784 type:complete len:854 (-) comp22306_c0_seq1:77-2638(-)
MRQFLCLLCFASLARAIDLAGIWTGFEGDVAKPLYDNYAISAISSNTYKIQCLDGPAPSAQPTAACGWFNGSFSVTGSSVSMELNTGTNMNGKLNTSNLDCGWTQLQPQCPFSADACSQIGRNPSVQQVCTTIYWENNSTWVLVSDGIEEVHIVSMNHLDVGYNGINPIRGFINNILNVYFHLYFPRAIEVAETLRVENRTEGFVYTTHPFLVSLYLDCPPNLVLSGIQLRCPSASEVETFKAAVLRGDITWHRGPMNLQPENMDANLFEGAIALAADLDKLFGLPLKQTLSQRDVPGMTRGVVPLLVKNNASAISIGVNGGSCPSLVPKLFVWKDKPSGAEILTMVHPYGYPNNPGNTNANPGGLARPNCITTPGFNQALCFAFRTDNSGPPLDIFEVINNWAVIQAQFPGATLKASTLDNFVAELQAQHIQASLPVVTGEIGDVWIQGISADPLKMAHFRSLVKTRNECLAKGSCTKDSVDMKNATRFLIKPPEHTWGLPSVPDPLQGITWNNSDFEKVRHNPGFLDSASSWNEQRVFNELTIDAFSSDSPFVTRAKELYDELIPRLPNPTEEGFTKTTAATEQTCGNFKLQFNGNGAVSSFLDTRTNKNWASASFPLAQILYQTFTNDDYHQSTCNGVFGGKSPHAESQEINGTLDALWIKRSSDASASCTFLASISMPAHVVTNYGAAQVYWVNVTVTTDGLAVNLQFFNKTRTRLAESLMFTFATPIQSGYHWVIDKLGTAIAPEEVITGGNPYQHASWGGIAYVPTTGQTGQTLKISSDHVPLVCVGTPSVVPSALIANVMPITETVTTMGFNIFNNVWNTNYIFWYPYVDGSGDENARYAFKLQIQ